MIRQQLKHYSTVLQDNLLNVMSASGTKQPSPETMYNYRYGTYNWTLIRTH